MDSQINWKKLIALLSKNLARTLYQLRKISQNITLLITRQVHKGLLQLQIHYGILLWVNYLTWKKPKNSKKWLHIQNLYFLFMTNSGFWMCMWGLWGPNTDLPLYLQKVVTIILFTCPKNDRLFVVLALTLLSPSRTKYYTYLKVS